MFGLVLSATHHSTASCVLNIGIELSASPSRMENKHSLWMWSGCFHTCSIRPLSCCQRTEYSAHKDMQWVLESGTTAPQFHNTHYKPSNAPHLSGFETQLFSLGTTLSGQDIGRGVLCAVAMYSMLTSSAIASLKLSRLQASSACFGILCKCQVVGFYIAPSW